jgi:hypothetical protein
MPEGLDSSPELVETIKQDHKVSRRVNLSNEGSERKLSDIIQRFPETEYIGKGGECVVVGKPSDLEKVIAFNFDRVDPIRAGQIYHYQRILSTLFPHNFPRFFASTSGDQAKTVRQRIISGENNSILFPIENVLKICQAIGIPVQLDEQVLPSGSKANFIVGNDGGEYYVDLLQFNPRSMSEWNEENLLKYMNGSDNSGQPRTDIQGQQDIIRSLRRLHELAIVQLAREKKSNGKFTPEWLEEEIKSHGLNNDENSLTRSKTTIMSTLNFLDRENPINSFQKVLREVKIK